MYLAINGYIHQIDETSLVILRTQRYNQFGIETSYVERWSLSGFLIGTGPVVLTGLVLDLEAAYGVNGGNLFLIDSDGVTIHRVLASAGSIGGVRVVSHGYPIGDGGEYTTYRTYAIEAEAEYPNTDITAEILEWKETLVIGGGRPKWVMQELLNGDPVRQQTQEKTKWIAFQNGRAVGRTTTPAAANPIWPTELKDWLPMLTFDNPDDIGIGVGKYTTGYAVNWNYEFESAAQLAGQPTKRPF